jgi:hypothetical protein
VRTRIHPLLMRSAWVGRAELDVVLGAGAKSNERCAEVAAQRDALSVGHRGLHCLSEVAAYPHIFFCTSFAAP